MKSNLLLWVVIGGLLLYGGYYLMSKPKMSSSPTPTATTLQPVVTPAKMSPVTIVLAEQSDLGQSGEATFTENSSGKVVVTLSLSGGKFLAPQPAHIHVGTCPIPGAVKYPLTSVESGKSVTTLEVNWGDLIKDGELLAVNVHKSAAESKVYTACGNLPLE